jgi:hypothetical protein
MYQGSGVFAFILSIIGAQKFTEAKKNIFTTLTDYNLISYSLSTSSK